MNRRITRVVGTVAALGLAALAVPGAATAVPGTDDLTPLASEPRLRPDNHRDPLMAKRTALRQRAVDDLVAGKARTVGKGKNRTIRLADGTEVDYPVNRTAQLLTFLIEFGDGEGNPAFPDNTAGPLHNEIAEPGTDDNSTYWKSDFSRQHFLDMFFNGMPEQDGESFHDVYDEMSSGRFDLRGDVSDWVQVEHPAAYYQEAVDDDEDPTTPPIGEENGASMTAFLTDGSDAWYDAQIAAGKSPAEIEEYLQGFDVWDRFDYDDDGDYNEPDGYIDHFQAIHAGEGEEAGAATWNIWSHRSSVNQNGDVGPDFNKNGGVEIGDSGLWIRDYTTEPENGGLGVFAHEFGHDLGLPDYYDTVDGDNSTGFWNLMSSGSWMGHGDGSTGTTPNHMGATEKLFLGWYGTDDLAIVDGDKAPEQVVLGPSYHATSTGAQAVAVTLPKGQATVEVVEPDAGGGTHYLYSGNGDHRTATATSQAVTVPAEDPTFSARVSYSIEDDWDYAHLKVSSDGGATWTYVETNRSTTTDPNQQNAGFGITGCSGVRTEGVCDNAWADLTADLTAYAGDEVLLQLEMFNDAAYHELGFSIDTVELGGELVADFEDGAEDWTLDGFRLMEGASYDVVYDQYYIAENRQYQGYDRTLAEGPYSYDYPESAPNKVDQFPYQDGLLVWYANGLYLDNNTSSHPGGGQALPVDANPEYEVWLRGDTGAPASYGSGRLNAYDATFDVDRTDALSLVSENAATDGLTYDVEARPGVSVFDDTDPDAYWDDSYGRGGWYSTKVAGEGVMIQVLSSDETSGRMVVKAGRSYVLRTSPAKVTGSPVVGGTLKAVAPTYHQPSVAVGYQWLVGGKPVAGARGASFKVPASAAGKSVSVRVTGTKGDYLADSVTSAPTARVRPAAVKLKAKAPGKVKAGKKPSVKVTVTASGVTPSGTVKVTWGGKSVTKTLSRGTATVKLAALRKKGAKKAVVVYRPGTGFTRATTKVTIKVV